MTVDYVPGFEERLAHATPLARYAAFIQDTWRATTYVTIDAVNRVLVVVQCDGYRITAVPRALDAA